jgi:hypothetical protein
VCVCEGPHIALLLEVRVATWLKSEINILEQKVLLHAFQSCTDICLRSELLVPYYRLLLNSEALSDISGPLTEDNGYAD